MIRCKRKLSRRAFIKAGIVATGGLAAGCVAPSPVATTLPTATYERVSMATPTPTATATQSTASTSPTDTPIPAATYTPSPTAESEPTATAMHTPSPTAVPEPTATPEPAATVQPSPTEPPTQTPAPTNTSAPTQAPTPTATPLAGRPSRADLIAHYPQTARSVVSLVQHDGVWDGDQIQSHVVLQMLDAAMTQLTGIADALTAWSVLFDPGEVVGIKVNTISRYTTTPAVAYAVAQRLQDVGLSAEQIVLFDRSERELKDRGFTINADGPGVRCRAAKAWDQPATVAGTTQHIHDVMSSCHALINIPALKEHGTSGFTSAMKNHFGTVNQPGQLHRGNCDPAIPELNALSVIRNKTRLIVGDFLRTCPYDWNRMTKENLIAMSYDPVAHDTVARQVLIDRRNADGRPGKHITGLSHYLDTAVEMGLGADAAHTDIRKTSLG